MMDCDFFGVTVDELVRGQLGDAGLKERALDHARYCLNCGIRLNEAREVSVGLAALAADDCRKQAPARVEAALLSYLREQRRVLRARRRKRRLAAAAAIIVAGIGVWSGQHFLPAHRNPLVTVKPAPSARPGPAEEMQRTAPSRAPSRMEAAVSESTPSVQESGFILLPYGQDAASLSGAQIVRVAVTPAALASLGVLVPDPSAETYVEADVVVGDDGVARAIWLGSDSGQ
ncbi:MAG: hypothetical protein ACRD3O_00190 [Terriglobia bacterium]